MDSSMILSQQKLSENSQNSQQIWKKPRKQSKYIRGENKGKWSDLQHLRYIVFIDFHKKKMRSKQRRRSDKFYKQMSNFIQTRNSLQCRSHHQKLEQRYKYPNKIVTNFKDECDKDQYRDLYEDLTRRTSTTIDHDNENIVLRVSSKKLVEVSSQTDLQGTQLNLMVIPNNTFSMPAGEMMYYQPRLYW